MTKETCCLNNCQTDWYESKKIIYHVLNCFGSAFSKRVGKGFEKFSIHRCELIIRYDDLSIWAAIHK